MRIPDRTEIGRLRLMCQTPQPVIEHMEAVALFQDVILDHLEEAGFYYNRDVLLAAALLHDICRTKSNHASAGAGVLRKEGYPEIAALVSNHHSPESCSVPGLDNMTYITHADILFYADKRVAGIRTVTIDERFAASMAKCLTQEALDNHTAQLVRARRIENLLASHDTPASLSTSLDAAQEQASLQL